MPKSSQEMISSLNGGRLVEYYDENGEKIGTGPLASGVDPESIVGKTITPSEDGKVWVPSSMDDIEASISLDLDTGNIKIAASQELLDDPAFKQVFNENLLKQYSSAYQRNPNFKVPDPFAESDGAQDMTIPEIIEKYNSRANDFADALREEMRSRQQIERGEQGYSNRNDIANRLTRNDFIIMGTNAMGEGANDDSLISIPKSMYADVNFLESFDDVAGTVKKGDFRKNVFSLIEKDEGYIHSLYNRLEKYFEEDNFEDTDEYARATALYSFLTNNDPDMTPLQAANHVTSNFFKGVGLSIRDTLVGLTNVATNILTFGGLYKTNGPISQLREFTAAGLEDIEKEKEEATKFINELSTAGSVALNVGSIGTDLATTVAGGGIAGTAAKSATIARMTSKAAKGAKAADNLQDIALTVAGSAKDLANGADLLIAANNAQRAAEIASVAAKTRMVATSTRVASTAADLVAQTMVEAVIYDPVVFSKVLQNQEKDGIQASASDDAYGYLLETAAWNIGGWGAFSVAAKGVKSFGKTKAGRYTNAIAQKALNKISVATGTLGESILRMRYGEDYLNASRSARKNQARKYNVELREAQRTVANQKIRSFDDVRAQEQNVVKLMNLHNSTDALQRGARAYINRMLNNNINPTLAGYEQKLRALGAKITEAERRAGLLSRRKIFRTKDNDVSRVFSKESANYLGARTQLDVLENIKRVRGKLSPAQEKGKELLEAKLEASLKKLPKEVREQLDEYLAWDRKFYTEYNNLRMREGSLNAKQIDELRAEGYWGKNGELYRPSYRVDPDKETKLVRNDDRVARDNDTATEQYVWGSDKDFMDPEIARYMYMGDAGATYNAAKYIEAVNAIPSSKAYVVYDAEEVARAQRMKDIKTPLSARIKSVTRGIFGSGKIATGKAVQRTLRLSKMRADWIKQAGATEKAEMSLARASRKKLQLTVSDKRTAIDSMSVAQIDEALTDAEVMFNFSKMESPEEFDEFYMSLDKYTKEYIQQRMGSVAGVIYPAEVTSSLEAAISNESIRGTQQTLFDATERQLANTRVVKNAPYITAENYNKLANADPSFVPGLKKVYAQNNKVIRDSSMVTKAAEDSKRAQLIAEREGLYKENLTELSNITKKSLDVKDEDAILREFDEGVTEYLDAVYADKKLSQTIDDIVEQSGTMDKEAAREYIVLDQMLRDDNSELMELRRVAKSELKGSPDAEKASDMFERMFEDKVYERRNIARQKLADENSTLVDRKSWMEEIRKLDKDITGKLAEPGYVSVPNAKGEMEIWEVDPIAADLYKYAVKQPEMSAVAKFFNETSKVFRLGTTGLNLMSFVNQSFRDFGNLWLTSGSYHMVNLSRAEMVNLFGPEIAEHYLREQPEIYEQLLKQAERNGKSIESMVVERELAIGRETSTQATETAFLKTVGDARILNKIQKGETTITHNTLDRAVDILSTPNELRERWFRNVVYADSLDQALKRGYTLKSARIQAEFMMNNATTNFSRQMVHLQALQRTVPYLGAAINGAKSFYRILSVDPVGVMSRFVGGFVVPIMAMTGLALADPTTRKKYEQLSEYEKDNNIIIPINGALMKVPIPQEIGPLVKPWQHLVEKMYGSNRHDFWQLMLNDALGISPVDITGFYDLDQDAMENPTIWDRLLEGGRQLVWGQMSPPPVKAAYMAITGKDPYTGKFVDTSYQYYDSESGEVVTMDSSQSAFAKAMANAFGGPAGIIAAATTALLGRTGIDVLDSVTSALQYGATDGEEGSLTTILERAGQAISKPITVAEYDRTRTAWNREISARYREKEQIINSQKYKEIEEAINRETDPEKRKKLFAQRQDMLQGWYDKVKVNINKLQDNLGGTIDRYRMASLISLLNMYEGSGGISAQGRAANQELYYEGRDEAIRALIDMGANTTGDRSILGYMTTVKHNDGTESTEVKFYKPLEILAMQSAWYGNASVSKAYVQELLEDGPIDYTQELKQVKKLRQQIYDKGRLTQADYSNINALELEWNARVMSAIAPYVERVSPESAINDEEVMEYLDNLILLPSEFKKDKNGRYVTDKKLGEGSSKDAYIKNYIRKIFEVNNSGYSTGRNYSGRQNLGGQ